MMKNHMNGSKRKNKENKKNKKNMMKIIMRENLQTQSLMKIIMKGSHMKKNGMMMMMMMVFLI